MYNFMVFRATIKKRGNLVGVIMPKKELEKLKIQTGDEITLDIVVDESYFCNKSLACSTKRIMCLCLGNNKPVLACLYVLFMNSSIACCSSLFARE